MSKQTPQDLVSNKLIELSKLVTAEDRKECENVLGVSKSTISDYLLGKVHNMNTANRIYVFLKKRTDKNLKPFLKEEE